MLWYVVTIVVCCMSESLAQEPGRPPKPKDRGSGEDGPTILYPYQCPEEEGWTLLDDPQNTQARAVCIKVFSEEKNWQDAENSCLDDQAHLITLDQNFYMARDYTDPWTVSTKIASQLYNEGLPSTWLSLQKQSSGRLWWMNQVPLPAYITVPGTQSSYGWASYQPDDSNGDCVKLNLVPQSQPPSHRSAEATMSLSLEMELTDCAQMYNYTCIKAAKRLPAMSASCKPGWQYDRISHKCFFHSGNDEKNYNQAKNVCQREDGYLVSPVNNNIHNVTVNIMRTKNAPVSWIGLTRSNNGDLDWESGAQWSLAASRLDPDDRSAADSCVNMDLSRQMKREWMLVPCSNKLQYICEMPADDDEEEKDEDARQPSRGETSRVTVQPRDVVITSDTIGQHVAPGRQPPSLSPSSAAGGGRNKAHSLKCKITNVFPGAPIVWVKDGIYINNGLPDKGFELTLNAELLEKLNRVINTTLDGYYHCEAWAWKTYRKIQSQKALVTIKDVIPLRVSLPVLPVLPGTTPSQILSSRLQYGNDASLLQAVSAVMDNVPVLNIVGKLFQPQATVDRIRPDGETVDLTYHYQLPSMQRKALEVLSEEVEGATSRRNILDKVTNAFYSNFISKLHSDLAFGAYLVFLNISASDINVRTVSFCAPYVEMRDEKMLTWLMARMGDVMETRQTCLTDGIAFGTAECLGDYVSGAYQGDVRYHDDCEPPPQSPVTADLRQFADSFTSNESMDGRHTERIPGEQEAMQVGEQVAALTRDADMMTYSDVAYCSLILENLALSRGASASLGQQLVTVANNMLRTRGDQINAAQRANKAASRILHAMETYASRADLQGKANTRMVQSKMALEIMELPDNEMINSIGFGSSNGGSESLDDESLRNVEDPSALQNGTSAIVLPPEILKIAREKYDAFKDLADDLDLEGNSDVKPRSNRVTFAIYSTDQFFVAEKSNKKHKKENDDITSAPQASDNGDGDEDSPPGQRSDGSKVNSMVVSATINGIQIENLTEPVQVLFTPKENASSFLCMYWNFTGGVNGTGNWSSDGCRYMGRQDHLVVCHCDHLTNFAILTDVSQEEIPAVHLFTLSLITYIGLALSILGLSMTILSFLVFRRLRKGRSQKVLVNLAVALLCMDIIFLAGINRTDSEIGCVIVAALLHYFLLAAFAWMLVEAVLQYLRFVKVLDTYVDGFMWKAAIPAWVFPAVPVAAVAGHDWTLLRGPEQYCWLSLPAFYYAFLIPVAIIIVTNTIIFILVIKGITCDRPAGLQTTQTKGELVGLQVRAGICCFVVMGMTWVFGFLAISDARLVFQYLFCILNSFQGFLIFIFHNIRERAVRDAWTRCCCPRWFPSSSATGSSSMRYSSNNTDSTDLPRNNNKR